MNLKKLVYSLTAVVLVFTSCTDDEGVNFVPPAPLGAYENGVFISNEGGFGNGNASISFVSNDFSTTENEVFKSVNSEDLGDVAQSMAFNGDYAYIIVNGSNKIEVVNRYTFESIATIDSGLLNPRYMAFANGRGYVTNWGDGADNSDDYVAVIDLTSNTVTSNISVGEGPEQILTVNSSLYVSHKGGWGQNNIVSVISSVGNTVTTTITVGNTPDEMTLDSSNNLWVISEGNDIYDSSWNVIGHTTAFIQKINPITNSVDLSLQFPTDTWPLSITSEGNTIYYYSNDKIYKMSNTDTALPTTQIIDQTVYQGLAVRNGYLYCTNSDFIADTGDLYIYNTTDNSLVDSKSLKEGSARIYFN